MMMNAYPLTFNLTRQMMSPKFNESAQLHVLDSHQAQLIASQVLEDRPLWKKLIQEGNFKLTADKTRYAPMYTRLTAALSNYLLEPVILKTPLDFFLFDQFDARWEKEPSGFIHNDWGNYAKCMREFADPEDMPFYDPSQAIALVLALELPQSGSGIELYDAFHGERGVNGKTLLEKRRHRDYTLFNYTVGEATLFCPFQYHSGHCAQEGTLKADDKRLVLVAFLIKLVKEKGSQWHMFRMCKGATLEYGDESLYGLADDVLSNT